MPHAKGHLEAVAARRAEVARLYYQGWPQHKIGERFGVCRQQITKDLAAIRREWQRVMVQEFDRLKAEQLAKIDAAEVAAWRGWRRSLKDAERKYAKVIDADGGSGRSPARPRRAGPATPGSSRSCWPASSGGAS
jgi:Homeodomain-like domain